MRRRGAVAGCAVFLCACGAASQPGTPSGSASPSNSATPQIAGTQRTVLSPLGLNVHSDPSVSASVVATAAQGVSLTVLDFRSDNGGWFKVMGQSTTGWITADPKLSAAGTFTTYSSDARQFSVLVPSTWTFNEQTTAVVFRPQQGDQTIVVRTAASTSALGPQTPNGYASSFAQEEVVCGYTGELDEYMRGASSAVTSTPSASGGAAPAQRSDYAVIRLTLDAMHAIELAYNYDAKSQLQTFEDFFNSITFPFPQCQAPAPSPSPSAAPPT